MKTHACSSSAAALFRRLNGLFFIKLLAFVPVATTLWTGRTAAQLSEEVPVRWNNAVVPPGGRKVGDVIVLRFNATVEDGWHLYSIRPKPPGKMGAAPTTLHLDEASRGIELIGKLAEYGQIIKEYDDVFEVDEYYFKKTAYFEQKVKIVAPNARAVGYLNYQSCNEKGKCVILKNEFDFSLAAQAVPRDTIVSEDTTGSKASKSSDRPEVSERTDAAFSGNADGNAGATPNSSESSPPLEPSSDQSREKSLTTLFFLALAGGLAAFLTPCVFPM
ncbi:MAG: protein-disulfide reductase DsbD family protein, partial [Bacteroidia bacterium]|nr:protein-disulfide reductase DsbD family protein [Bacteroidia bacterium]MDW8334965.1 protein-disulfide reductase DsbD family protein [Bacteroidia bacterium]